MANPARGVHHVALPLGPSGHQRRNAGVERAPFVFSAWSLRSVSGWKSVAGSDSSRIRGGCRVREFHGRVENLLRRPIPFFRFRDGAWPRRCPCSKEISMVPGDVGRGFGRRTRWRERSCRGWVLRTADKAPPSLATPPASCPWSPGAWLGTIEADRSSGLKPPRSSKAMFPEPPPRPRTSRARL